MANGTATTISIVGDKDYVRKVRMVALAQGVRIGDLVRDALDKHYGDKIAQVVLEVSGEPNQQQWEIIHQNDVINSENQIIHIVRMQCTPNLGSAGE